MPTKGLLAGKKFNGRHQTVIPSAQSFVKKTKEIPAVTKISIGIIKPCSVGPCRIKVNEMNGFLSVKVRGTNAVQSFAVYGTELESIAKEILRDADHS